MSDDLHKYPGNLRHHEVKVPRDVRDYLRTISDQSRLIQQLVDALDRRRRAHWDESGTTEECNEYREAVSEAYRALEIAAEHGFIPSGE